MKKALSCIIFILLLYNSAYGQALYHSKDLVHVFSPQTLKRSTLSFQMTGSWLQASDQSHLISQTSFGMGVGKYIDLLTGFEVNSETEVNSLSFAIRIGDPPFLTHHLGLMPTAIIPLAGDEAKPVIGLRFMHVVEPDALILPTKLYLNYGYFWQAKSDQYPEFNTRDFYTLAIGVKTAVQRTVFFADFSFNSYLDNDAASFQEADFSVAGGVRIPFKWLSSISLNADYHFATDDLNTSYQPHENAWAIGISVSKVIFPGDPQQEILKRLFVEQIDRETEMKAISDLQLKQKLTRREIEALDDLITSYQRFGGKR